jgi:hypothetical protein
METPFRFFHADKIQQPVASGQDSWRRNKLLNTPMGREFASVASRPYDFIEEG